MTTNHPQPGDGALAPATSISTDKPPVGWQPGAWQHPSSMPTPMQAWPAYPPSHRTHYGLPGGGPNSGQNASWSWLVIVILLGTFVAMAGAAIVAGSIVWLSLSKRDIAAAPSSEVVIYSSSPSPDSYPAPADAPYEMAPTSVEGMAFEEMAVEGVAQQETEGSPAGGKPAPVGTRLVLAASVNDQQTTILLNDVSPLVGVRLPLTIRIDEESMSVTAVDEYRTALTVERTGGVYHSVSAAVEVIEATSGESPSAG